MGGAPAQTSRSSAKRAVSRFFVFTQTRFARPVRVALVLRDDPLEAALARRPRTGWRVLEPGQAAYADREAGGL